MQNHYESKGAIEGPDLLFEFESNKIELDIPMEGITIDGGWKINPHMNPVVYIIVLSDSFKHIIIQCHTKSRLKRNMLIAINLVGGFPDVSCQPYLTGLTRKIFQLFCIT